MTTKPSAPAWTVMAMRPIVPARDFDVSRRFYVDLGFRAQTLKADELVEMHFGTYSFILQNYYVPEWADNFVMHLRVSDLRSCWSGIVALDLPGRYGVKVHAPYEEDWGLVAGVIDPSGVLWRIAEIRAPQPI